MSLIGASFLVLCIAHLVVAADVNRTNTQCLTCYGNCDSTFVKNNGKQLSSGPNIHSYVTQICVRYGNEIENIMVTLSNGQVKGALDNKTTDTVNCTAPLRPGTCFNAMSVYYVPNKRIVGLQFLTSDGSFSPHYGSRSDSHELQTAAGKCLSEMSVAVVDYKPSFFSKARNSLASLQSCYSSISWPSPSAAPSLTPTTSPTMEPTLEPTYTPTMEPTEERTSATSLPPSATPQDTTTTQEDATPQAGQASKPHSFWLSHAWIYVLLAIVVCLLFTGLNVVYWRRRQAKLSFQIDRLNDPLIIDDAENAADNTVI